ncbi:MAG: SMC-Scp complex subunit ScpB [Patescibacteria group bacterium]|nr:SMC-Scp complex subunit ScpB [Patescibacteria group bacterium]
MKNNIQSQIEAILFAAGEPIEIRKLASFLKVSNKDIEKEILGLEANFQSQKRGLQIFRKGNTIQLVSAPQYGETVAKFLNKKLHEPLSQAALEVLSVIAYRGPVTRMQIEHIRGVNCSFTLRNLAIRGVIDRGESPTDSRAYLYEVSYDFLKNSGLKSVRELPDYNILHSHTIPQVPRSETNQILKNHENTEDKKL